MRNFYDFLLNHKKWYVFLHKFMQFFGINLWQKVTINLWAISIHKFMAKKCAIFMIFFWIIKNDIFFHKFMQFFGINLWQKVTINLWAISTQKFMATNCTFFFIFFGIIKNAMFFCINLCNFLALIYEKKVT